ncbi:hypothetical protein GCM10020254_33370 [Streptomyces goshikiensis]
MDMPARAVLRAHAPPHARPPGSPCPTRTAAATPAYQEDPHMSVMRHTRRRIAGISATAVVALALGAAAALPAAAADGAPQGVIENAGAADAVPGSYIVTLKDSAARSTTDSGKAVAKRYGAKIDRTYSAALNGYSVAVSEAQARKLAADPAVASVVQNRVFTVDDAQGPQGAQPNPPSWGLDRIDQRALPLDNSYTYPDKAGEGVTAYIIDTGVRITHGEFGTRASYGYDAIDNDNTAQDGHGHGTHVAGTVAGNTYGVAKKAKIVGVRVLDNNGSGTTAQVVAGIDWVTRNAVKPAVANMSLGGGADSALDTAVRNSIAAGITYGVAAGNESTDASTKSPARVAEAITVGATTSTDAKASYSNYGSILDIFAPPAPRSPPRGAPATPPPTPSPVRRWPRRTSWARPPSTSRRTRRAPRPRSPRPWWARPPRTWSPVPDPAPRTGCCTSAPAPPRRTRAPASRTRPTTPWPTTPRSSPRSPSAGSPATPRRRSRSRSTSSTRTSVT